MTDTGDDGNYFHVERLDDGSIHVRARAEDNGVIGHIDRVITPDDPDFARFAQHATGPQDSPDTPAE